MDKCGALWETFVIHCGQPSVVDTKLRNYPLIYRECERFMILTAKVHLRSEHMQQNIRLCITAQRQLSSVWRV